MTSYQKLKARLKENIQYTNRLLDDKKFYLTEVITYGVRKEMNKRLMFGDSKKPAGKIGYKFKGLLSKIKKA